MKRGEMNMLLDDNGNSECHNLKPLKIIEAYL